MLSQLNDKRQSPFAISVLMAGLLIVMVLAVVGANLWKSELRIAEIRVNGNTIVPDKEILSLANIDAQQKLYSVDLQAAQSRVMQNAFIKTATVNREAPNVISITVRERIPIAAVVLDQIKYLDVEGVVLPSAHPDNIFDIPVLTGVFQPGDFAPGKQIAGSNVREALDILVTAQQLGDELYRRISEVHIENGKDIVLYTAEFGVPVIFGHDDAAAKLVKFDGFWSQFVHHRVAHELAYVDLRFEDQVVVHWNHSKDDRQETKTRVGSTPGAKRS